MVKILQSRPTDEGSFPRRKNERQIFEKIHFFRLQKFYILDHKIIKAALFFNLLIYNGCSQEYLRGLKKIFLKG